MKTKLNYKVNIPIDKLIEDIENACFNAVDEIVKTVEADAVLNCPVDKGRLRESIMSDTKKTLTGVKGDVGTNVEYAYYADRKQPYLSYSVDKNKKNNEKIIEKYLDKVGV